MQDELKNAYVELKNNLVKVLFEFSEKYCAPDSKLYPYVVPVMLDAVSEIVGEVEYQTKGTARFTQNQIDHICYQIGDWYLMMKPLLEVQHNLGHMKEKLKTMICGEYGQN